MRAQTIHRETLDELLVKPLKEIAGKAEPSADISKAATRIGDWLLRTLAEK
jgi:hypothetical protein